MSNPIDGLLSALFGIFIVIFIGYVFGRWRIVSKGLRGNEELMLMRMMMLMTMRAIAKKVPFVHLRVAVVLC